MTDARRSYSIIAGMSCVAATLWMLGARCSAQPVSFRAETGADAAELKYGASGAGVAVVIMDRGIDWDHPDFINPDGTTRIQWLYDMSPDHPQPVEYSAAQINAALRGGSPIDSRDAVGHGTVTTGLAAGNGRAAAGGAFRGMAPQADLIIIKVTSEGAPAHDDQPAEAAFNASYVAALDWLDQKLDLINKPAVGLFNSGTQYGPIDGTSAVSRKIDEVFGADNPRRVYVAASGDEGRLPNHARAVFDDSTDTIINLNYTTVQQSIAQMWYTGDTPANITLELDDGTTIGPVGPNQFIDQDGVVLFHYDQHAALGEFLETSGDDRFVYLSVTGHMGTGRVRIRGISSDEGTIDLYSQADGAVPFLDHLAPGRLSDFASTQSAIVAGAHVLLTDYVDVDSVPREVVGEGAAGELWPGSSGGPTRDGRFPGVDVTAPGHNAFAAYAQESYWETFRFNLIEGGDGWYGRGGATSGSAPLVVGAVALLLEAAPSLTANEVRELLRSTATTDSETGPTPNPEWGFGKLNVLAALDSLCADGLAKAGYCSVGNFNNNGVVDAADYVVWRDGLGSTYTPAHYELWRANFGKSAGAGAKLAAVPEPSGAALFLFGLLSGGRMLYLNRRIRSSVPVHLPIAAASKARTLCLMKAVAPCSVSIWTARS